jgi:hypothetical protein
MHEWLCSALPDSRESAGVCEKSDKPFSLGPLRRVPLQQRAQPQRPAQPSLAIMSDEHQAVRFQQQHGLNRCGERSRALVYPCAAPRSSLQRSAVDCSAAQLIAAQRS